MKKAGGDGGTTDTPEGVEHPKLGVAPKESLFDTVNSQMSSSSAFDTLESSYADMTKDQKLETRKVVKEFVKAMVRGQQLSIVAASGELRTCFCSISRKLDILKVSVGEKGKSSQRTREIPLSLVTEVAAGGGSGVVDEDLAATINLATEAPVGQVQGRCVGCRGLSRGSASRSRCQTPKLETDLSCA